MGQSIYVACPVRRLPIYEMCITITFITADITITSYVAIKLCKNTVKIIRYLTFCNFCGQIINGISFFPVKLCCEPNHLLLDESAVSIWKSDTNANIANIANISGFVNISTSCWSTFSSVFFLAGSQNPSGHLLPFAFQFVMSFDSYFLDCISVYCTSSFKH